MVPIHDVYGTGHRAQGTRQNTFWARLSNKVNIPRPCTPLNAYSSGLQKVQVWGGVALLELELKTPRTSETCLLTGLLHLYSNSSDDGG